MQAALTVVASQLAINAHFPFNPTVQLDLILLHAACVLPEKSLHSLSLHLSVSHQQSAPVLSVLQAASTVAAVQAPFTVHPPSFLVVHDPLDGVKYYLHYSSVANVFGAVLHVLKVQ